MLFKLVSHCSCCCQIMRQESGVVCQTRSVVIVCKMLVTYVFGHTVARFGYCGINLIQKCQGILFKYTY